MKAETWEPLNIKFKTVEYRIKFRYSSFLGSLYFNIMRWIFDSENLGFNARMAKLPTL